MRPWGVKRLFRFPSRTSADVRADVVEEFAFHLDMRIEELRRSGLSETAAHAQAMQEFGDRASGDLACTAIGTRFERRRRLGRIVGELRQDTCLGLRLLARSPGFATAAILTLALGIGANVAIYSVLDAVLLRPLPFPEPDRLVQVAETLENGSPNNVSGGAFLDWREHQTHFEALALTGRVSYNLRGRSTTERLTGLEVSHEFFRVIGIPPLLGRGFRPEEERAGGPTDVVVITEALWRSRFGSDEDIIGRSIILDEVPRTIVGVLPRGAWVLEDDAFFVPAVLAPGTPRAAREPHWAAVFGRLAPTATVAEADAELKGIKRRLNSVYPVFKQGWSVVARPVTEVLGGLTRTPLLILLGAVSLVLLIACANVANLVLVRGCHREREMALRAAIGVSSGRLMRQALTESATLAALGGAAGVGVAYLGVRVLRQLTADAIPFTFAPQINLHVLAFTMIVTAVTGVLCGLLPAVRARKPDLNITLNNGSTRTTGGGHQRTQSVLVVAQVALTVILLASAGLLLRSLAKTATVDPGFDPERVLAFDVSLPDATYESPERRLVFASGLLERLRAMPGVEAAGTGMAIPFSGGGYGEYFRRPDRDGDRDAVIGRMDFVSPGYLESLGARLRSGRFIGEADNRATSARLAVISETTTTARLFFPDGAAVEQLLRIRGEEWRVIGVVGDIVDRRLDAVRGPFGYVPQVFNASSLSVVVRSSVEPLGLVNGVHQELARLDPGVALANPRALDDAMAGSLTQRKVVLSLVATFAAAALLLACIGIYGVMAYAVATRRREIGIRIALGAVRGDVVRHVLRGGVRMMAAGLLLGIASALGAARLLASELYEVSAHDPLVLAATTAIVGGVALLACWIPAWRAVWYAPVAALRTE